jgi:hypothetical protein
MECDVWLQGICTCCLLYRENMEDKLVVSRNVLWRGAKYCVADGPNKISCNNVSYTTGISMHKFPKDENQRKKHW